MFTVKFLSICVKCCSVGLFALVLGVNGYGFIVTNNGYVLTHPDLRPVYQGILKAAYNRVDITELEILDDEAEPREFGNSTRFLRYEMVMQKKRNNFTLAVKTHIDDMRRLITGLRHYYYMGIKETPFSMSIALPHRYGKYRLEPSLENEIGQLRKNMSPLAQFFTGKWTIHPFWHYCRYADDRHYFENPEDEFVHFLKRMGEAGWNWSDCDRKLICKVVNDAKITNWFSQDINTTKEEKGCTHKMVWGFFDFNSFHVHRDDFMKRFGITVAFVTTHSGLTRWQDFPQSSDANGTDETPFHVVHNKAIDEVWYKRAVEYYFIDQETYLYSVPFDEGNQTNTLLTVSHAIFREEGSKKAPAAVVGYQSHHSAFHERFRIITKSCGDHPCKRTCETEELDCFLLDDNGYVIVSDNLASTGYFFGKIRPDIMSLLVDENIYNVTRMYDYQGLCPEEQDTSNPATTLFTPWSHMSKLLKWCGGTLLYFFRAVSGSDLDNMSYPEGEEHEEHQDHETESEISEHQSFKPNEKEFTQRLLIKKTSPQPCDQEMYMYNLIHYTDWNISNSGYNKTMTSIRPYIVQKVAHSNMIFLVINNLCPLDDDRMAKMPDPVMVDYNMSLACYRVEHDNFTRRHYMSCINRNVNESEIKLCGGGTAITHSTVATFIPILLFTLRFCTS